MKRLLAFATAAWVYLAAAALVNAEDDIFLRGKEKPVKGVIASESAKGITLKIGGSYPAEAIEDIQYEVTPTTVRLAVYKPAFAAEQNALKATDPKKQREFFEDALKKYQEAAGKVNEPFAKRHCEYKVAALTARLAVEEGKSLAGAIDLLKKFKAKYPDSWQLGGCLQLLGRIQLDDGDFTGAAETFSELARANVPDDVKQEAQLLIVQVSIRKRDSAAAKKALDEFLKSAPPGSKHFNKGRVLQAELAMAEKNYDAALAQLRQVIKETTDKSLKALAYNAAGVCLYEKEDYKAARWEFLWVDVEYNQDKNEHAKALYYLWKTFLNINETEKAQECLQQLLTERAFQGTEWRAKAQKEQKTS
ncbi:MAG: tetratricopeptide repeat protein [Gemmataceae bacterium]|nr:tetratricopeptide repeat protein [Gemmataceae bacterium]